jgi:uncharacterized RDD family membrane protein YckC
MNPYPTTQPTQFPQWQQSYAGVPAVGSPSGARADLGSRFLAAMIDGLLTILSGVPGAFLVLLDPAVWERADEPGVFGILGSLVLLGGLFVQAVLQWFLIATRGQSIGKIVTKIHIRKQDGSPVDFVSGVVLRAWAMAGIIAVVNLVTCGFLGWVVNVVDAAFIFGDDRRCLHDQIAGTDVLEGHSPEVVARRA